MMTTDLVFPELGFELVKQQGTSNFKKREDILSSAVNDWAQIWQTRSRVCPKSPSFSVDSSIHQFDGLTRYKELITAGLKPFVIFD